MEGAFLDTASVRRMGTNIYETELKCEGKRKREKKRENGRKSIADNESSFIKITTTSANLYIHCGFCWKCAYITICEFGDLSRRANIINTVARARARVCAWVSEWCKFELRELYKYYTFRFHLNKDYELRVHIDEKERSRVYTHTRTCAYRHARVCICKLIFRA